MQSAERQSTENPATIVSPKEHRDAAYTKFLDNRKHAIRGLWRRNNKFVARIRPNLRPSSPECGAPVIATIKRSVVEHKLSGGNASFVSYTPKSV